MNIKTIFPLALVAALLTGCAEDDAADIGGGRQAGGAGEPVALTIAPDAQTRAVNLTGTAWEGGEEVAVSIGGTVKKYVVGADKTTLSPASGVTPFTWSGKTETKTVTAWYPYADTKPAVTVPADQSTADKFRAAIMLEASVADASFGPVALPFTHRTAKVSVMAHDGNGDSYDSDLILLTNLSGVSSGTTVKTYKRPVSGGYFFEALVAPQTIAANTSLATLCRGGDVWTYKHNAAVNLQAGGMENINITYNSATRPNINGHKYVEMGDGKKWATCNVGATNPMDYGDYFAWGETATKSSYSWSNYAWGDGSTFTKYTASGAVLEAADDAATANWGSTWRTPTDAEWTWLRENCTWTWQTDYNGTGVAGFVVTSKVSGFKTSTIFLPAAGYWSYAILTYAGSYGYYWSSSLHKDYSNHARYVGFHSGGAYRDNGNRYYGQSVRPVSN